MRYKSKMKMMLKVFAAILILVLVRPSEAKTLDRTSCDRLIMRAIIFPELKRIDNNPTKICVGTDVRELAKINRIFIAGVSVESEQDKIELANYSVSAADFAGLTKLKSLWIDGTNTPVIAEATFAELSDLEDLLLNSNKITTLQPGAFRGLVNLKNLQAMTNNIKTLPPGIFQELRSLKQVDFGSNEITSLSSAVFSGLSNIETILLGNNKINDIADHTFVGLPNLRWLSLRHNSIDLLTTESFAGLDKLEQLDLDQLNITEIPAHFFESMHGLKRLNLSENRGLPVGDTNYSHARGLHILADSFGTLPSVNWLNLSYCFLKVELTTLKSAAPNSHPLLSNATNPVRVSNVLKGLSGLTWADLTSTGFTSMQKSRRPEYYDVEFYHPPQPKEVHYGVQTATSIFNWDNLDSASFETPSTSTTVPAPSSTPAPSAETPSESGE